MMNTSSEEEHSAEKDREIEIQAAVFVVFMFLCGVFVYLCAFLTADENYVEPTQKICQNLLQAQRVTRCVPQSYTNRRLFFEQAFPVGEVDLHYVETAMNGFEMQFSRVDVREYDLGFSEYVRFTFSDNQLKTVHYYDD